MIKGNEWPHIPPHKEPSKLEEKFNHLLTGITEVLSDGQLTDISILDLPAFGAKIDHLEKGHKKSPNWPTEINFALHNSNSRNLTDFFFLYKSLLDDWKDHMESLYDTHPTDTFTHQMRNNEVFNFTKYIKDDMKTFLLSVAGKKSSFFYLIFSLSVEFMTGSNCLYRYLGICI